MQTDKPDILRSFTKGAEPEGVLMKHIRIKSFGLALMMVLASFPMSATTGFAAPAATVTTPKLSFIDGNDPKAGYLITGKSVLIGEEVPSGYTAAGLDLTRAKIDGDPNSKEEAVESTNKKVTIGANINGRRTITFDEFFDPVNPNSTTNKDPKQPGKAVYAVNGRYYAAIPVPQPSVPTPPLPSTAG